MKWFAISGSWQYTTSDIERDVRVAVNAIMRRGDGIVTGGALGVDFIATVAALAHDPSAERIKIIIPTSLERYSAHYRARAGEGVITSEQAESLCGLLQDIKRRNSRALVELEYTKVDQQAYYDRNTKVLASADELLAFQVNGSLGTQDTIDKAAVQGMTIDVKRYEVKA